MKIGRIALMLSSGTLISACAYTPPHEGIARRVSPDYTATGPVEQARASIYGNRTILEIEGMPFFLAIRDKSGNKVEYERIGRYYRLDRQLDYFTAWINGRAVTFSAAPTIRVFSSSLPPLAVNTYPPVVHVTFPTGSIEFKPKPEVAKAIAEQAKVAKQVIVRGRTDSSIAGSLDGPMALGRALAARSFMIEQGISSEKIRVFSKAAGDFVAPNDTPEGKALNRRVEIEFTSS
jgi:hypothetical protein